MTKATEGGPKHATLTEALIAAQAAFGTVRKEATNPHFKSKYADLATVIDAVLPHLNANGILLTQPVISSDTGLMLRTSLKHTSGDELVSNVPLPPPAQWQQWGSALTYARRYTIMALLGVAPEDDDGNEAVGVTPHQTADKPRGEVTDASRKAELAKRAHNAPSPSEPPASEPVATTATGRNEFFEDLDRELDRALASDGAKREWNPESVRARGAEIASALRDHGQQMMNLVAVWQQHADEIMTMPSGAQKGLRKVYDEEFAELDRGGAS